MRVRTVGHEAGWGWIARDPSTGVEVWPGFRWASRSVARDVVRDVRDLAAQRKSETNKRGRNR